MDSEKVLESNGDPEEKISSGRICIIISHDNELLKNCDEVLIIEKNSSNNEKNLLR